MVWILLSLFVSAAAAEPERWEYAAFASSFDGGTRKEEVRWLDRDGMIAAPTEKELTVKLVAAKVIPRAPEKDTRMALFDALGDQGWELIQNNGIVSGSGAIESYRFKRRK